MIGGAVPWWRIATLVLLLVAFGLTVSKGSVLATAIVAVLIVPYAAFLTVWTVVRSRSNPRHAT